MNDTSERLLKNILTVQVVLGLLFGLYLASNVGAPEDPALAAAAASGVATSATAPVAGTGAAAATAGTVGTGTATSAANGTTATAAPGASTGTAPAATPGGTTTRATAASTPGAGGATGTDAGGSGAATTASADAQAAPAPATGGEGTRIGVTDEVVRVGTLVSQTGSINFRSSAQATKAYFDMINEQGGVHGRRIELMLRDDGLDPNRGQQAVEEMLNTGIFSFVAFNAPLTEQSMIPVLERNDIDMVGSFAMGSHYYSYRFGAGYQNFGKVGGLTACDAGAETVGLIYISNQNETLDANIYESWRRGLEQCGLYVDDDNLHGVDVTKADFTDVVTSLQFAGVDTIGTILDATAMIRLQQALNRQGYSPTHIAMPFGADPAVLNDGNVGSSFAGTYVLSDVEFLDAGTPDVQAYVDEVTRRFGDQAEINWAGEQGWVSARLFVDVLEAAGPDPTRERFREAMWSLRDYDSGLLFPITITEDVLTHNPNKCLKVGRVGDDLTVSEVRGWTCVGDSLTEF